MVGDDLPLPRAQDAALLLESGDKALDGLCEVLERGRVGATPGGNQRRLVDQIGEVGPGETGGEGGNGVDVELRRYVDFPRVDSENGGPSGPIWAVDEHLAVEASGTQQSRIEHLRPVGRREHDDAQARIEAVHLGQELIERLLLLVVTAAGEVDAARASERIELVDEDDGRSLGTRLLEEIAHTRGANADEHLDELGAGDGEERHAGLARHRARQQRLAGPRRPHQQHAQGMCAPSRPNAAGSLRKPTTSVSSCLASSTPATSANAVLTSRSA